MSIRDKPIYISTEVSRMLWLLAKAEGKTSKDEFGAIRNTTPDEIADTMLRQAIRESYPQLPQHLAAIDKLEKEIVKTLSLRL